MAAAPVPIGDVGSRHLDATQSEVKAQQEDGPLPEIGHMEQSCDDGRLKGSVLGAGQLRARDRLHRVVPDQATVDGPGEQRPHGRGGGAERRRLEMGHRGDPSLDIGGRDISEGGVGPDVLDELREVVAVGPLGGRL